MATHATARSKPRLHRLPIRTDYVLIPAPLDLSLPEIAQKSPLPPIIVTPSSPSSTRDFSLAFLPTPPKPSLRERIRKSFSISSSPPIEETKLFPITLTTAPTRSPTFTFRTRSIIALLLVLFLATCHFVAHRVAVRMSHPYIEFAVQNVNANAVAVPVHAHAHRHAVPAGDYPPTFVQGHDVHPGLGQRGANPVAMSWFDFRSRIVGNSVVKPTPEVDHVDVVGKSEAVSSTT